MRYTVKVKFKPGVIDALVKERNTTLYVLADELGISYTQLYRTTLPIENKHFSYVGADLIAGLLHLFPDARFEQYFDIAVL